MPTKNKANPKQYPTFAELLGDPPVTAPVEPEQVLGTPLQSLARDVGGAIKQGALPMIGMAGMGMMTGGTSLPLTMAAEAIGAVGGTGANMALGLQEPSGLDALLAAAPPVVIRGLAQTAKGIVRHLPGSELLKHEIAAQEVRLLADKIVASGSSKEIFATIDALANQSKIPVSNLRTMASNLLEKETTLGIPTPVFKESISPILDQFGRPRLPVTKQTGITVKPTRIQNAEIKAIAKGLLEKTELNQGSMTYHDFQLELSRFGSRSGFEANRPKEVQKAYKQLFAAAEADLDAAAVSATPDSQIGSLLKAGHQAYNLERTSEEVADLIGKHIQPIPGELGAEQVNIKSMLKDLSKHKRFLALPLEVRSDIQRTLALLNNLPPISTQSTERMMVFAGMRGAIGGAAGFYSAGPLGGVIIGAGAVAAPAIVAGAIKTAPGRSLLRYVLTHTGGTLDERALTMIGTFLNAQRQGPGPQTPATIEPRPFEELMQ